ncbi:hypothetical protein [Halobacteriovorax sp. HLS]|nr:hypothetical protein [Halobacteriovorax sp. HLS]
MNKTNQYRIQTRTKSIEWKLPAFVISMKLFAYSVFVTLDWMAKFN